MGFDDFDDEDDVDSYEIDTPRKASSNDFSEVEGFSEAEDKGSNSFLSHQRATPSYNGQSRPMRGKAGFSSSEDDELGFDTDEELSVHPNWKSSHVADSRHRNRDGRPTVSSRGLSFGSDEESGLDSDLDDDLGEDFRSSRTKGKKLVSGWGFQRNSSDMEDDSFSGSESVSDDLPWHRNRSGGNKMESGRRGKTFEARGNYKFVRDTQFSSSSRMDDRRNSTQFSTSGRMDDRRNSTNDSFNRKSWRDGNGGRDSRTFRAPKREGYRNPLRGRSNKYDVDDYDAGEFKNSRRVFER